MKIEKNLIKKELIQYYDGSKKLAQYAYDILNEYVHRYYDDDYLRDGENFFEYGDWLAGKDDYYYTAFWAIEDYGAFKAGDGSHSDAICSFESIIDIYMDYVTFDD